MTGGSPADEVDVGDDEGIGFWGGLEGPKTSEKSKSDLDSDSLVEEDDGMEMVSLLERLLANRD